LFENETFDEFGAKWSSKAESTPRLAVGKVACPWNAHGCLFEEREIDGKWGVSG